ncbi:hypothetical protein T265_00916 [Opisthorchis viverrini]|uniref:Uncharacterized protein n=1 Tax=Opisthorchis viverrini TaxID=6198 RepID=A0A075A0L5_OPIVI|nr:hypothetical protein T265_00916 [Opisthorchis viverrini]KER33228.1 hypothetical protein T265_00916 [Opisthorchis viverrini]
MFAREKRFGSISSPSLNHSTWALGEASQSQNSLVLASWSTGLGFFPSGPVITGASGKKEGKCAAQKLLRSFGLEIFIRVLDLAGGRGSHKIRRQSADYRFLPVPPRGIPQESVEANSPILSLPGNFAKFKFRCHFHNHNVRLFRTLWYQLDAKIGCHTLLDGAFCTQRLSVPMPPSESNHQIIIGPWKSNWRNLGRDEPISRLETITKLETELPIRVNWTVAKRQQKPPTYP